MKKVLSHASFLLWFYFASLFNVQNRSLCAHWIPLARFPAWRSLAGFLLDNIHCKVISLCNLQDGCSVTLTRLSSAAVSMGFSSSAAFQTLLRFALDALLRGVCTSAESAWSHQVRERTKHKKWRTSEAFSLAFCVFNWIPCKSHILDPFPVSLLPCSSPPAASISLTCVKLVRLLILVPGPRFARPVKR